MHYSPRVVHSRLADALADALVNRKLTAAAIVVNLAPRDIGWNPADRDSLFTGPATVTYTGTADGATFAIVNSHN